jgi:pimeloyl-ACP methyl ester carboxylesterase
MVTTVLCLHGCIQSAEAFRRYLKGNLIKMGQKYGIRFEFIDAPFEHPNGGRTWTDPPLDVTDIWQNTDGTRTNAFEAVPKLVQDHTMLTATFERIEHGITETGATVLLGFSQGAFAVYEYLLRTRDPRIAKAVAIAGYTFARAGADDGIIVPPLDIQLLNAVNPLDSVVPASLAFTNAREVQLITHDKIKRIPEDELPKLDDDAKNRPSPYAHVLPSKAVHTRAICTFISGSEDLC